MIYKLSAHTTVSCYCEVEAASEAEARLKADELTPALSYTGSGNSPETNWLIEDADGVPEFIRVESSEST